MSMAGMEIVGMDRGISGSLAFVYVEIKFLSIIYFAVGNPCSLMGAS
jgi:hypothetical protein